MTAQARDEMRCPHVTTACVVSGRFPIVDGEAHGVWCLDQPAGHLEDRETLIAAARRRTPLVLAAPGDWLAGRRLPPGALPAPLPARAAALAKS